MEHPISVFYFSIAKLRHTNMLCNVKMCSRYWVLYYSLAGIRQLHSSDVYEPKFVLVCLFPLTERSTYLNHFPVQKNSLKIGKLLWLSGFVCAYHPAFPVLSNYSQIKFCTLFVIVWRKGRKRQKEAGFGPF